MIELSYETEALVRRLAAAQDLSVDETVRQALQACGSLGRAGATSGISTDLRAERRRAIDDIVAKIGAMPRLDPRSSREITDDLDPL